MKIKRTVNLTGGNITVDIKKLVDEAAREAANQMQDDVTSMFFGTGHTGSTVGHQKPQTEEIKDVDAIVIEDQKMIT